MSKTRTSALLQYQSQTGKQERGQLLKGLRESCNLSQTTLATLGKLGRSTISEAESGKLSQETEDKLLSVMAERLDLAYIAGLIDRKSSINIFQAKPKSYNCRSRTGYEIKLLFTTKHKTLTDLFVKVFGVGRSLPIKTASKSRGYGWVYQVYHKEAEVVFQAIYPYLKIKRAIVGKILTLREIQNDGPKGLAATDEHQQQCEKIYKEFLTLKKLI